MLYCCYAAARLWTVGFNWPRGLKVWVCGVSPFLLNVGSGQLHVPAALPQRKTQYPLNKGLGGPQSPLDVLKNRKIFCSRRESNLRRLYSDSAGTSPGSVQIRCIILVLACKGCLKGKHHENPCTECSKFGPIYESGTSRTRSRSDAYVTAHSIYARSHRYMAEGNLQ